MSTIPLDATRLRHIWHRLASESRVEVQRNTTAPLSHNPTYLQQRAARRRNATREWLRNSQNCSGRRPANGCRDKVQKSTQRSYGTIETTRWPPEQNRSRRRSAREADSRFRKFHAAGSSWQRDREKQMHRVRQTSPSQQKAVGRHEANHLKKTDLPRNPSCH